MKTAAFILTAVTLGLLTAVFISLRGPTLSPELVEESDMQTIRATIKIDAPIQKIWSIIGENFDQNKLFNSNAASSEYIKKTKEMVRSQRRTKNLDGKFVDVEIVDYKPKSYFVRWDIIDTNVAPIKAGYASYSLVVDEQTGQTLLTQKASFKMKLFLLNPIAKRKFSGTFRNELTAIKHFAETNEPISQEIQDQVLQRYVQELEIKHL